MRGRRKVLQGLTLLCARRVLQGLIYIRLAELKAYLPRRRMRDMPVLAAPYALVARTRASLSGRACAAKRGAPRGSALAEPWLCLPCIVRPEVAPVAATVTFPLDSGPAAPARSFFSSLPLGLRAGPPGWAASSRCCGCSTSLGPRSSPSWPLDGHASPSRPRLLSWPGKSTAPVKKVSSWSETPYLCNSEIGVASRLARWGYLFRGRGSGRPLSRSDSIPASTRSASSRLLRGSNRTR